MDDSPGFIHAGYAPSYWESRFIDPNETELDESIWQGVSRKTLKFLSIDAKSELFLFSDGFVLHFYGAALDVAEQVASCYLQLAPLGAKEAHFEDLRRTIGSTLEELTCCPGRFLYGHQPSETAMLEDGATQQAYRNFRIHKVGDEWRTCDVLFELRKDQVGALRVKDASSKGDGCYRPY